MLLKNKVPIVGVQIQPLLLRVTDLSQCLDHEAVSAPQQRAGGILSLLIYTTGFTDG